MANPEHTRILMDGGSEWWRLGQDAKNQEQLIDLRGIDLHGRIDFTDRWFLCVDFTGANLSHAHFDRSRFDDVILREANLSHAFLPWTRVKSTDLGGANLTSSMMWDAVIERSDLTGACLINADLAGAHLVEATLDNADFATALAKMTVWAALDLRQARNLEQIYFVGPSSVALDTIIKSQGQIPKGFLRGCGVPDEIISYVHSLALSGSPIQLYSCFISYSSKDQEFCQRLHNDLQAAGVRCWFAPEDLKIGDRFRDVIESAIRMHDKLLLVLSDNSVRSDWVQTEVESALERERRQSAQVLFPVRLDDAVMDTPQAWAADVRRKRHMGDFSGWKNHDEYKKAFDRLLRDLRAKPTSA